MELIKGIVRVEWQDIGEGFSGDYNPDDPDDEELLRFYVSVFDPELQEWVDVDDASYCTLFRESASDDLKSAALRYIMGVVYDDVVEKRSIKGMCESLSWISSKDKDDIAKILEV